MFTWLKTKQTGTDTGNTNPSTASTKSADGKDTPHEASPALKAALGTADAVLEAHTARQRKAAVQAWVATNPDDAELARVAKLLQDKDSGAAKLIKEVLAEHKTQASQSQAWGELQARAHALLHKPELQAQDAVQLDEALHSVAAGEHTVVPPDLIETCERIALRLQNQASLQAELRTHVQSGSAALTEVQHRFSQAIQQAQAAWPELRSNVGAASAGLQAAQEHKEWLAMPSKLQTQAMALQSELNAAWQRFESQLAMAAAAVDDVNAALPEVASWSHELQVLRGAEQAVVKNESAAADEAAKAARRAAAAASLAEFKLALTQLERALEQGHTKEAMGQANRLRNLHLADQPANVQTRAHELLAKVSQLSDWQRWRSDQLREELCVKAEALAAEAARHDTHHTDDDHQETAVDAASESIAELDAQAAQDSADVEAVPAESQTETLTSETTIPGEVNTDLPAVIAGNQDSPVASISETSVKTKSKKPMSPRAIGDALKALREEWKVLDKTGESNGAMWSRFDAACKLAYAPVEAWHAQEKQRTEGVEKQRRALIAELKAWADATAPAPAQDGAAEATTPEPDWKTIAHSLDKFNERWRNAGHLPEKRFVAMQNEWKTAMDAAAAPLLAVRADSKAKREAMIARVEALCATPNDAQLQNKLRELQAQWTAESKRVLLPRHVEQKLWERFRSPQDAAYNAKRAEHEQRVQAQSAVEGGMREKIAALEAAAASGDEAAIREAGRALEAAWAEFTHEPAQNDGRNDRRDQQRGRREDKRDHRRDDRRDDRGPRVNPQLLQAQRKAHDAAHKKLREIAQGKRGAALEALMNAWRARDAAQLPEISALGLKLSKPQWQAWQQKLGAAVSVKDADRDAALLKLEVAYEVDSPAEAQSARRALQLSLLASRGRDALVASWPEQLATVLSAATDDAAVQRLSAALKRIAQQ